MDTGGWPLFTNFSWDPVFMDKFWMVFRIFSCKAAGSLEAWLALASISQMLSEDQDWYPCILAMKVWAMLSVTGESGSISASFWR